MARGCLREAPRRLSDVEVIVATPARRGYRAAPASHLRVPVERITVADDERTHTASLTAALHRGADRVREGGRVLLVAAGAGVTAGAALPRAWGFGAIGPSGR